LLGSGVYGSVYLANDVLTKKQVACKIVDLRRKAVVPSGHDTPLDGAHKKEVQAFAEQEKGVSEVRKKLIREIEILSKLSHVRVDFSSAVFWLIVTAKYCYSLQSFSYTSFSVSQLAIANT
jgi:serine/threonine protein kinase